MQIYTDIKPFPPHRQHFNFFLQRHGGPKTQHLTHKINLSLHKAIVLLFLVDASIKAYLCFQ